MNLREKMLAMLDSTRVEEFHGVSAEILIPVSRAIMFKANVYIWADIDLHVYVRLLKSWGLNVHRVVSFMPKDFQKVDDVEVISPAELFQDKTPNKFFFVDACAYPMKNPAAFWNEQMKILQPLGVYLMDNNDRQGMVFNAPPFDIDKLHYYQSHKKDLMELFDSLADETSKRALYFYVESFIRNCIYRGEQHPTRLKYFFGGKYERLYKHLDGECWINCGANIGDTVFAYLSFDFKPKKIYAFEGDKKIYDVMLENLSLLPPDKRALVEPINQMIDEQTDFEKILAGNKCTLLNADIEGAELKLLHAMEKIIRADRPVMAMCVYHFKEDILSIPQFLQSICPDYIFYLRKHTSYHGHWKKTGEMVLYAVPVERSVLTPPPRSILIVVRDKKISNDIMAARNLAA
ncbi:MAG: FkbM family methyltransferase [Selenomonadaceae bacterium]|nr:FkbM family methyltransferase [Selenomonadaceae bacterium]